MKLPLFPHSDKINDKWWHRLAKILTILCILVFLFYSLTYVKSLRFGPGFPEEGQPYRFPPNYEDFIFIPIIYFICLIIYRIILYVVFGEKWKDEK